MRVPASCRQSAPSLVRLQNKFFPTLNRPKLIKLRAVVSNLLVVDTFGLTARRQLGVAPLAPRCFNPLRSLALLQAFSENT